ncbi:GTP-binding protein HflX [Bacilli bacterium PM5-9]|nr:GTP-binding protein HflX [Bacilli bacterium PM5-9]
MKKAVLVGIGSNKDILFESMLELENLALANNIESVENIYQTLDKMNVFGYVGKGKLEEIKKFFEDNEDVNILIANDELSASQIRNIIKSLEPLEITVMDRTMLILDIFSSRAKTKEAIIQVEIAKLQHDLAHLVLKDENYDQQRGDGSLSNKGSGEKRIDIDRRVLKTRIHDLKTELSEINKSHLQQKKQRIKSEKFLVSLVGYTNAGKSTLMNNLINEDMNKKVFEKNMLFATLDTSVRKLFLPNKREVLLSDTVGFIDKLPHQLVTSFKTTLEEAIDADLIIHVVDYHNPSYKKHIEITNETLKSIGVSDDVKRLYVYNKADLLNNVMSPAIVEDGIIISAKDEKGIELLKDEIVKKLFSDEKRCRLLIPYSEYSIVDYFIKKAL